MAKSSKKKRALEPGGLAQLLQVGEGFSLAGVDPGSTPGFQAGKSAGERALAGGAGQLAQLQERLFAATGGDGPAAGVLLVVQGMDTAGKGGILRHVIGSVDPQGVEHTAFKKPTPEELSHDFLWRIRRRVPGPGMLGVFDRSHYEDVLVVRVHNLVPEAEWSQRYNLINEFEAEVAAAGIRIVKVMLHISPTEQLARLAERLIRPDKFWKYNPGDLTEHESWPAYQEAYQVALTRCSTAVAPWHVVPADQKWYARWAVQQLLVDALADLDPQWPAPDFDLEVERDRIAAALRAEGLDVPREIGAPPHRG